MTHALVLLCGGLSTRMGTNKAFLPFGEYTLIEYQVRRFRPNFEKIYLSVPKMTDFWMNLAEKLDCQAIPDRIEKLVRWEDCTAVFLLFLKICCFSHR